LFTQIVIAAISAQAPLVTANRGTNLEVEALVLVCHKCLLLQAYCRALVRLGGVTDGGKWVCNPFHLRGRRGCLIFSLGVNNEISFDVAFQRATLQACHPYAFDKVGRKKLTGQHCRYKLSIILGNKFDVIPAAVENTKICQILVEVHGSATDNVRLLQIEMSRNGYYLLSYEINGYSLNLCEYSLIHESCLDAYGAEVLAKYFS
uniref:Methyltranfer_dom domain-containing protein n=1 Tax=Enterobius vermicularis TaxID=51028 RepID=A0A0N4VKN6_ENTVE